MYKLLILDDEPSIINAMVRLISRISDEQLHGKAAVRTFTDPAQALECIREEPFDLIVTDFRMPSMDGLTFLQQAIEHQPDVARIIISGHADLPVVLSAVNAGIFRFVSKPWDDAELQQSIVQALKLRSLHLENQRLADLVRIQRGELSRQEAMLRQLESESPGITRVERDAEGAIMLELE